MQYLGVIIKTIKWSQFIFKPNHSNITVIQVYAPTTNAEETGVKQFSKDLQDLLELTPKKDVLFITGDWNAKVGSQEISGVTGKFGFGSTKWSRAKANRLLLKEHTGHSKHLFQQYKGWLYTWISPELILKSDWLYSLQPKMEKLYTLSKNKTWSGLWLRSSSPYCKIQA